MHSIMKAKLGIGTVQFGLDYGISNASGKTSLTEAETIIRLARAEGLTVLDTASAYGDAEKTLGQIGVPDFQVVSKFISTDSSENLKKEFLQSLESLHLKKLYGYLAHRPLSLLADPGIWSQLLEWKCQGKIEKVGASFNTIEELQAILGSDIQLDLVQVPYNYFDRRFERYFPLMFEKGWEIHVRSVYLQGLFFVEPASLPAYFNPVKPILKQLQNQFDNHLSAALLRFVLENAFVEKVILGINTSEQLASTLANLDPLIDLPFLDTSSIPDQLLIPSNWPQKQ